MNVEIKIPTLLGLGVLLIGLLVGVALVAKPQFLTSRAAVSAVPKNITVVNLSGTTASIYWQTEQETTGFVKLGTTTTTDQTFTDDRDSGVPKPHLLHFVTLTNLSPNTTYYYKVTAGSTIYPTKAPLTFQTVTDTPLSDNQPIIGTALNADLTPASEAVITLKLPNATLATITKMAGNFILPLANLSSFTATTSATLTIFDFQKSSKVQIQLPSTSILPPITLGEDLDLTPKVASPTSTRAKYDLNGDGVVNSLDLAIILKNLGKNPKIKQADLNEDGVVDQKDVNLMNKAISQTVPK
ncbi:fibronectin type III domain-containing protein [Candidatus Daviesbacteria bacterium]|nr:fibronectin type III domain-containing protein [Candidatus Daviesbacteria bacterium]